MASPPKMKIPAYGSSRSTGGVIGGKAHGNTFNIGDANAVWEDMDVFSDHPAEKPVHGKIQTYVSDLNPSEIDLSQSSFVTKVYDINKCQTILLFTVSYFIFSGDHLLTSLHRSSLSSFYP